MTPVTFILVAIVIAAVVGFIAYKRNSKFKDKVDSIETKIEDKVHDIKDKV